MSGGKGKRGAPGPLPNSSDEEEPPGDAISEPPSPVPTPTDHEYDNVGSPGNSSTASGPIYVRQPGFTHHAHEVTITRPKVKKKKTTFVAVKEGLHGKEPTPPKAGKPRRAPLPMRMRALPQSFWQQPNNPVNAPPCGTLPVLPPLFIKESDEDVADVRPVTPPPEEVEKEKTLKTVKVAERPTERRIHYSNADLLFKLFENVEKKTLSNKRQTIALDQKRWRARKVTPPTLKDLMTGEDPYLIDCTTDKLFPQLKRGHAKTTSSVSSGNQTLHVVTVREGDRTVTLPSLNIEQNYPQMLSELVMHI